LAVDLHLVVAAKKGIGRAGMHSALVGRRVECCFSSSRAVSRTAFSGIVSGLAQYLSPAFRPTSSIKLFDSRVHGRRVFVLTTPSFTEKLWLIPRPRRD